MATQYQRKCLENITRQYVEIKCQLDATGVFIADLIACSTCFGHHYAHRQELKSIIQWLLPVAFPFVVFKLLVWCGAERLCVRFAECCSILQTGHITLTKTGVHYTGIRVFSH